MHQNYEEIQAAPSLLTLALSASALLTVLWVFGLWLSRNTRHRHVNTDKTLIRNFWQRNAIIVANLLETDQVNKLEKMLQWGQIDPNQRDERPVKMSSPLLVDAVGKGHVKFALQLIGHPGTNCNLCREDGTTALIMAGSRGHERLVKSLLNWSGGRLNLNARNSNKSTALIVSARSGHVAIVRMLLGAGADRTCAQYTGLTALHFACREGHHEIVKLLLHCPKEAVTEMLDARDKHGFTPMMYSCRQGHHKVVNLLLNNTSTQTDGKSVHGTAMHVAAMHNNYKALMLLLDSGKVDPTETDAKGRSALDVAIMSGNRSCEMMLMRHYHPNSAALCSVSVCCSEQCTQHFQLHLNLSEEAAKLSTNEFSTMLHNRMLDSGFSRQRATFQAGAADLLAELGNIAELRDRFDKRKASGSFADGWGSSLRRLNGSVGPSSDVDMSVQQRNPVHVEGACSCSDRLGEPINRLEKGFLRLTDVCGDKPSKTDLAVGVRPSMDFCSFRSCCCCPVELQTSLGKLPSRFQLADNSEVEFVRSVRPECTDLMEMRISCTSLEKEILRQLSTCQGQVFVIIKHIFKHVLAVSGFKSYHAKTLMFFLICEIPETQWRADRLESLVADALLRFEHFVSESEQHRASTCMPHFFIPDAWVYFKTDSEVDRQAVLSCLRATRVRRKLRSILANYMDKQLQPLRNGPDSPFVFQPFILFELVTPFRRPEIPVSGRLTRYQEIYPMVFKILEDLGNPKCSTLCESLSGDIDSLPDSAETAGAVLRVLMLLKLGRLADAQQVLIASENILVKRSIDLQAFESVEDAKRCVLHQLERVNSAWKFCFHFNAELDFKFLPDQVTSKLGGPTCGLYQLPGHILFDFVYFVNFDAVLKVLRLCLIPDRSAELASQWHSEVLSAEDAEDIHELYLLAKFTSDKEQLRHCLLKMESLSVKLDAELEMISEVQDRLSRSTKTQKL